VKRQQAPIGPSSCIVVPASPQLLGKATAVADNLGIPVTGTLETAVADVALVLDYDGAWLQQLGEKAPGPVAIDFATPAMEHRRKGGHNELLGRAVGVTDKRRPRVFDATAGLGRDAFVLADLGCEVVLAERSPILAWLLEQGVQKALISGSDHVRAAAGRMTVMAGDSTTMAVAEGDVIYLDPMFTDRKNSAAVKKDLGLLQLLHRSVAVDSDRLFAWATRQPCNRIVVKRPLKAPSLEGPRPSHALKGKAVRFDVYVGGGA